MLEEVLHERSNCSYHPPSWDYQKAVVALDKTTGLHRS